MSYYNIHRLQALLIYSRFTLYVVVHTDILEWGLSETISALLEMSSSLKSHFLFHGSLEIDCRGARPAARPAPSMGDTRKGFEALAACAWPRPSSLATLWRASCGWASGFQARLVLGGNARCGKAAQLRHPSQASAAGGFKLGDYQAQHTYRGVWGRRCRALSLAKQCLGLAQQHRLSARGRGFRASRRGALKHRPALRRWPS